MFTRVFGSPHVKIPLLAKGACLTPEVPNGKFTPSEMGWYRPGSKIRVTCDEGFMHQNFNATAVCKGGSWSSIPVCISKSRRLEVLSR